MGQRIISVGVRAQNISEYLKYLKISHACGPRRAATARTDRSHDGHGAQGVAVHGRDDILAALGAPQTAASRAVTFGLVDPAVPGDEDGAAGPHQIRLFMIHGR
eukprot:SAG31_NODE_934_length_10895_cov_4.831249_2_plen_104_part_00